MLGRMAAVLGVCMVAVVVYCLARSFVPALRPEGHRRDLDAWHVAMGGAMAAMLLFPQGRAFAVAGVVVFLVGVGWSCFRISTQRRTRATYLRLGIGCAAMAVMLVPAATASVATAAPAAADDGHAMHHHVHAAGAEHATAPAGVLTVSPVLVVVLLALLAAALGVRVLGVVRRGTPAQTRLDACCEVLMGAAMTWMLVPLAA